MVNRWIQKASKTIKKGRLHQRLGYPTAAHVPNSVLSKLIKTPVGKKVTVKGKTHTMNATFKREVVFACNVRHGCK